ncbi:hypothetical protein RND71_021186 [Anisodus tanguticus]|uniref:Uncharacterized protein n=1 Tax=Anisodus tanguticus TaxID=243964 RepID=A0AAE1V818_9SOLA|nr:hypothetical protein RND71_021186 [Anisodus tanguticus]
MNMCSKDIILKQEQIKLAASSIENLVNGSTNEKGPVVVGSVDVQPALLESKSLAFSSPPSSSSGEAAELKVKEGLSRCSTCKKKVFDLIQMSLCLVATEPSTKEALFGKEYIVRIQQIGDITSR